MPARVRSFLAEDAWLLIGVVTLPLGLLAGLAGLGWLTAAIFITGWLLLCPLFLFWGDEVGAMLLGSPAEDGPAGETPDPLRELQTRYARGEIDEAEFERRLEVLLGTDPSLGGDENAGEPVVEDAGR